MRLRFRGFVELDRRLRKNLWTLLIQLCDLVALLFLISLVQLCDLVAPPVFFLRRSQWLFNKSIYD